MPICVYIVCFLESENGYEETIPSGRSGHSRRNRVPTRLLKSLRDSNKVIELNNGIKLSHIL